MTDTCLDIVSDPQASSGRDVARVERPAVFGRLVKVVLLVGLGFIGGLLVSTRTADVHHGPVNVAVHLNGAAQTAPGVYSSTAPELAERKLQVGGALQDDVERLLKKTKSTSKPTNKPTNEPTVQATFPHGTDAPSSERRLKKTKSTSKPTNKPTNEPTVQATFPHGTDAPSSERRQLKKSVASEITLKRHHRVLKKDEGVFAPGDETYNPTPVQFHPTKKPSSERRSLKGGVFAPGDETYNPTPVQFHPTKKPSSERRQLKKTKSTSKPTNKPTNEPTVQATFPHGTDAPSSERRQLKKTKSTNKPTQRPSASPTFQATFPHGTDAPSSERRQRSRVLKSADATMEAIKKAATADI